MSGIHYQLLYDALNGEILYGSVIGTTGQQGPQGFRGESAVPESSYGLTLKTVSFETSSNAYQQTPIGWTSVDSPFHETVNDWGWSSGSSLVCPSTAWYSFTMWGKFSSINNTTLEIYPAVTINGSTELLDSDMSGNINIESIQQPGVFSGSLFLKEGDTVEFSLRTSSSSVDTLGVGADNPVYLQIQSVQATPGPTGPPGPAGGPQGLQGPETVSYGLTLSCTSATTGVTGSALRRITWTNVSNPYSSVAVNEWNWAPGAGADTLVCPASGWYSYTVWQNIEIPQDASPPWYSLYSKANDQILMSFPSTDTTSAILYGNTGDIGFKIHLSGTGFFEAGNIFTFGIVNHHSVVEDFVIASPSHPIYLQIQSLRNT